MLIFSQYEQRGTEFRPPPSSLLPQLRRAGSSARGTATPRPPPRGGRLERDEGARKPGGGFQRGVTAVEENLGLQPQDGRARIRHRPLRAEARLGGSGVGSAPRAEARGGRPGSGVVVRDPQRASEVYAHDVSGVAFSPLRPPLDRPRIGKNASRKLIGKRYVGHR
jgi:hypothetical protein